MLNWIVLIAAGLIEAVWATALSRISSPSDVGPISVWLVGMAASMAGLGFALKGIEVGTAYAVWTSIGAVATVLYGVAFAGESMNWLKAVCLLLIIAGVVGLRLLSS